MRKKAQTAYDSIILVRCKLIFQRTKYLTPNTPLIQLWYSGQKLNMDEIYYWICNLMQKSPFLWSKKDFPKKALRMEEFQNNFY